MSQPTYQPPSSAPVPTVPSKAKAWGAMASTLLGYVIPWVVAQSVHLPQPWPAVIAAVVAVLGFFGVYHLPYNK